MFVLVRLILNFFSGEVNLPLVLNVGPSPNIITSYFCDCQNEMMKYYQHQKLQYYNITEISLSKLH